MVVGAGEESSNATGVDGNQSDNSASVAGRPMCLMCQLQLGNVRWMLMAMAGLMLLTDGLLFIRYMFGIRSASWLIMQQELSVHIARLQNLNPFWNNVAPQALLISTEMEKSTH